MWCHLMTFHTHTYDGQGDRQDEIDEGLCFIQVKCFDVFFNRRLSIFLPVKNEGETVWKADLKKKIAKLTL